MSSTTWPRPSTLIPELLRRAPQARSILDQYGLRGCGGPLGPEESLEFFARAHDVPLDRMLDELHRVLRQEKPPVNLPVLGQVEPQPSDTIYRPFFKAGIAVVLTLGAVWGAWLLLKIAWAGEFAAAGIHDVNAHGHAQIFGWVGLFVMGFAYQAFPRFKHSTLLWPRLAFASLGMMLAGLIIRSIAQPLAVHVAWAYWPAVAASVLEVAAVAIFATIIVRTWRKSGQPLTFYDGYILAALAWFVVQAVYESVYLAATLSVEGPALLAMVATWQPPLRDIQIHGFAMLMILGVSQRIFYHFYEFKKPSEKLSRAMLVVINAAILGEIAGFLLMRSVGTAWVALWYASVVTIAVAVAALVYDWRIFGRCGEPDRSIKFLRTAYGWLLISMAMAVALPAYQFGLLPALAPGSAAVELGFSHAYFGAIRHAITVGFVSLMIMGVAAKVVPTLNGIASHRLSALWAPFVLVNLGCALRVVGQTATDIVPAAFPVAGISGMLEVTGLALWGAHLWLIMAGRPRIRHSATRPASSGTPPANGTMHVDATHDGVMHNGTTDGAIGPRETVGSVLERHPELLAVFVQFGFHMLAQPQMRHTIARVVTIERACRRMEVDLPTFLAELNRRRGEHAPAPQPAQAGTGDGPGCGPTLHQIEPLNAK